MFLNDLFVRIWVLLDLGVELFQSWVENGTLVQVQLLFSFALFTLEQPIADFAETQYKLFSFYYKFLFDLLLA